MQDVDHPQTNQKNTWLEKICKIRLVAFDVDGVLTDGSIIYGEQGEACKFFNVKDGYGIKQLNEVGYTTAIITGRESKLVEQRAQELGIHYVFQSVKDKLAILNELCKELSIDFESVAYMGDDLPDLSILEVVGVKACPSDAVGPVLNLCNFISRHPGGRGAVRDLCDNLLSHKPHWL